MRRIYDLLNAALLGLASYAVLSRYPALPGRIPVHFGLSGAPDRWGSKSELFVFIGVMWGMTLLFYALTLSLPRLARSPRYLNIPNKEKFLKLHPDKQAVFWSLLQEFMTGMAVALNLVFYLIVQATLRVVEGKTAGIPFKEMSVGLVVLALMIIVYLPRIVMLPKRLVRGEAG
jgi:uncharacterized membrane protein